MIYVNSYRDARLEAIHLLSVFDCQIKNLTICHEPSKYGNWQIDYDTFAEGEDEDVDF